MKEKTRLPNLLPLEGPQLLETQPLLKTRLFCIEQQALCFSNGVTAHYERLVSQSHGAVLVVPVTTDGLVLIREWSAGVGRYELGFPKGKIDPGETWQDATARECQEEIGFRPTQLTLLDKVSLAASYMDHHTHLVLAQALEISGSDAGDEPEPLEIVHWPIDDWPELVAHPEFSEGRAYAALFLTLTHLGKLS
ncbi:ADP compounds hydrolase NudE [Thiomicrospira cyclica]|uniref:NUDIX hydrolase n=1 Tax=Thiomicrospira cyclica (strain DSM 14477 / JCM 11371 / ALM1) TaxID=717773 RepID=F6DB96_THICA|nr:ADP compounds hydrolase NudE [Thiomicrospira cyclica]AEG31204.1 NUDIX hydrolase [Thiomicrospira cyclica ALM1]